MRSTLMRAAVVALGIGFMPLASGWAEDNPSEAEIEAALAGGPPKAASTEEEPSFQTRGIGAAKKPETKPGQASLWIPFSTGSAEVSPAAAQVLDKLALALMSVRLAEAKFRIEGHTDTVGSPEANKALSERRAGSVVAYLAAKHGIDRARMVPVGMGQEGLLIETGPNVAEARNRRVLVVNLGG